MAISVVNQTTGSGGVADNQMTLTPTPGNWLVAIVTWTYLIQNDIPVFNVADASRNPWHLVTSRVSTASTVNQYASGTVGVQVWVCPNVEYPGWQYLYLTTAIQQTLATDLSTVCVSIIEIAGMGNGYLTVDSVIPQAANAVNNISLVTPTPSGGVDCLQIAAASSNIAYGSYVTTGAGWTQLGNNANTPPENGTFAAWRESTTGSTVNFSLTTADSRYWAGVVVSIRQTGIAPTQPNANWPAIEYQIGNGYDLSSSLAEVYWSDATNRFWSLNAKRGIQYELGSAQAEPTVVTLRNNDGAFSYRAPVTVTATGSGSTTTFVCSSSSVASLAVGDFFRISHAAINTNPNFESGTTGWSISGGTLTTTTAPVFSGTASGVISPNGSSATVQLKPSTHATVTAGVIYTFSGWIYSRVARSVDLQAIWYNGSNVVITTNAVTLTLQPQIWTQFTANLTAPVGAVSADVAPTMSGTPPTTNVIYVDEVYVARKAELTLFQVTKITTFGGTSTVTFTNADATVGGGALVSTVTGDTIVTQPSDVYTPYRVMATWGGKRRHVTAGWSERWPATWRDPYWGTVGMIGTGALAQLTAGNYTPVQGEILRRSPYAYWPLSDTAGQPGAVNISGRSIAQLIQYTSKNGAGTSNASFGASTQGVNTDPQGTFTTPNIRSLIGDPGSGWQQTFDSTVPSGGTIPQGSTDMRNNLGNALVASDSGFPSIANGITIMLVLEMDFVASLIASQAQANPTIFIIKNTNPGAGAQGAVFKVDLDQATSPNGPSVTVWDKTTHASTRTVGVFEVNDTFSTVVATINQTSWALYVNNNLSIAGTCNLVDSFSLMDVGGEADQFYNGKCMPGLFAHVAVFDRVLSVNEITSLYEAVRLGFGVQYEYTGNRVQRKLDTIKMKTGRVMDASGKLLLDIEGTDATTIADVCGQIGGYEDAIIFEDAAGVYQYRPPARYAYQSPRAVLGERPDLGDIPYQAGPELDRDPTYLYNSVTVLNTILIHQIQQTIPSGVNQITAVDDVSASRYNLRTYSRNTRISQNQSQAVFYLAYWLLWHYASLRERVQSVTLNPAANPSIWPFVLGVEVGDLVTFKRRPIGAPEIDIPCMVLQVTHDTGPSKWQTTLTLGAARSSQLIVDSTTFGIVGTNVLGLE